MAEDREKKIKRVYEALCKAHVEEGWSHPVEHSHVGKVLMRSARAAVDLLDPVKRFDLSGGFHAQQDANKPERYALNGPEGFECFATLGVVRAWAEAAISHQKLNRLRP